MLERLTMLERLSIELHSPARRAAWTLETASSKLHDLNQLSIPPARSHAHPPNRTPARSSARTPPAHAPARPRTSPNEIRVTQSRKMLERLRMLDEIQATQSGNYA